MRVTNAAQPSNFLFVASGWRAPCGISCCQSSSGTYRGSRASPSLSHKERSTQTCSLHFVISLHLYIQTSLFVIVLRASEPVYVVSQLIYILYMRRGRCTKPPLRHRRQHMLHTFSAHVRCRASRLRCLILGSFNTIK